ncbi:MAG: Crp/Fnr family transcriptional regulator [Bacteroidota bacterium]|nr:Crp/Fnr family transcriptional regulator [Bacteroidota bacterium]MDP3144080.1 Crp/Fnr family transcriptional regulator [Bacteroidota bacterium]MDP3558198.1 Crp/Fnr family transcriptional regulator [Bacteroidota bacterium]
MLNCASCVLFEKCIASSLKGNELLEFEKIIYFKAFKEGEILYRENQKSNELYIIKKGSISLEHLNHDSQPIIMRIANSGEFLGLEVNSQNNHYLTAIFLKDSKICVVPKSFVEKISKCNQLVPSKLVAELLRIQEKIYKHFLIMISGNSEAKLAQALISLGKTDGVVSVTKEKIALMTGLTRETVSRILSRLNSRKIIQTLPRSVNILNSDELLKIISNITKN